MTFLQALAGARRYFYISYSARSVTDGATLEPSPVVGELLDYLHGHHFAGWSRDAFREALITEQAMQPFSARYFRGDEARLFTFADAWRPGASAQGNERAIAAAFIDDTRLPEPDPTEPVALADLQRFFRHPAEWFFRERVGLDLSDGPGAIADDEPRDLGPLERHLLRARLFATAKAQDLATIEPKPSALERARGALPPPPLGAGEHAEAAAAINAILPLYRQWRAEAADEQDIDLVLDDGTRVLGHVAAVGPHELRRLRPGGLRLSHLLPWWIEYLTVAASGREVGLRVAGCSEAGLVERAGAVSPAEARSLLTIAIGHYREGQARALLFEPYLAEDYLKAREKGNGKTADEALNSLNGWLNNSHSPHHAIRDRWLQPLFGPAPHQLGADADGSTLVRVAEEVARPLRERLTEPEAADAVEEDAT